MSIIFLNCGSVAAAIFFAYYYDHINTKYVLPGNITSDGFVLTRLLTKYIEPGGVKSIPATLKSGMNTYLKNLLLSDQVTYVTTSNLLTTPFNKVMSSINSQVPCIISIVNHLEYENHWVVETGYDNNTGDYDFVTVNDGWGHTGISISVSYIYATLYMD